MPTSQTIMVLPQDSEDLADLATHLNTEETVKNREIVDFGLAQGVSEKFNVADYVFSEDIDVRPRLSVFSIDPANAEAELRQHLATHMAVAYTPALIGGKPVDILIARAGQRLEWRGKMSTFGGPKDTGMKPDEGLALIQPAHFADFRQYFAAGATGPLGRSLNPDTFYIACRWDRNVTPYSWLRQRKVVVRNPVSGETVEAQPMDWGPAAWTGRVADVSQGVADKLKLKTDDVCEVLVPLPFAPITSGAVLSGRKAEHNALIALANRQHSLYSGCDETDDPLFSQIGEYWTGATLTYPGNVSTPWSAAFISWCLKAAGATAQQMTFSGRHSIYIHPMIQNAKAGTGNFRAHDITAYAPKVGDLVHYSRDGAVTTYAQADASGNYDSHSAIVVGFGEGAAGRYALTIGGNEGDSVRRKEVPLNAAGTVKQRASNPFLAVVETFS